MDAFLRGAEDRVSTLGRATALAFVGAFAVVVAVLTRNTTLIPFSLVLTGLASLAAALLWLSWFRMLYRAAERAGLVRFPRFLVWLWAWFVPGVQLVVPKMMVNDVWRVAAGDPAAEPPALVQLWWAATVVSSVELLLPGDPPRQLKAVALLAGVAAGVLAPFVAARLTRELRTAYDRVTAPVPAP